MRLWLPGPAAAYARDAGGSNGVSGPGCLAILAAGRLLLEVLVNNRPFYYRAGEGGFRGNKFLDVDLITVQNHYHD